MTPLPQVDFTAEVDMNDLLQLTTQMQSQPVQQHQPKPVKSNPFKQEESIVFQVRKQPSYLQPHDITTQQAEAKLGDFILGAIDVLLDQDVSQKPRFTDLLLQTFPNCLFVSGFDRSHLSFQKCLLKLQNGEFDEEKYKVQEGQDESGDEAEYVEQN